VNWDEIFNKNIPQMDSVGKIYKLFEDLGYETLPDNYKVSKHVFSLRKDEERIVDEIYIISNYRNIFGIYLIVLNKESASVIRTLSELTVKNIRHPLILFTHDFKNYDFVLPEQKRIDIGKFEFKRTYMHFDRMDLKHTDKLIFKRLALTDENIQQIYELKQHGITSIKELEKKMFFFFFFVKDVFSIEKVTEDFFRGYENVFKKLKDFCIKKSEDIKWSHHFSHQMLNRLMFLYFIQKKEWLGEDTKFMIRFYKSYGRLKKEGKVEENTFYTHWLSVLFFYALCRNPAGCHRSYFPKEIRIALKIAPHLNGGLFNENRFDRKLNFLIPDSFFDDIFDFLERYNFTIKEDLPLETVVAVDPEMIGRVYESLVNVSDNIDEKGEAGIFYTARTEIDFMCRRALVEYLSNHLTDIDRDLLYDFVFSMNEKDRDEADEKIDKLKKWDKIVNLLESITVVDPACGSGSFLVGMLNVLTDLLKRGYKKTGKMPQGDFDIKKKIIGKSLYGVDVKEWAAHIAELRLWLQLIIETNLTIGELHESKPLLPNLSFHIRVGDSLVPDIGGFDIYRNALKRYDYTSKRGRKIREKINYFKREKRKYYNNEKDAKYKTKEAVSRAEIELMKDLIDEEIKEINNKIFQKNKHINKQKIEKLDFFESEPKPEQTTLDDQFEKNQKEKAILEKERDGLKRLRQSIIRKDKSADLFIWDLAFVEIFSGEKKSFDIVIGNPPYVRQENIAPPSYNVTEMSSDSGATPAVPGDVKRKYKERIINEIKYLYPKKIKKLDKKSDLYIYFYFNGLHLLNEKGVFCFITSNSWLDVGYGKDLQEFLLKNTKIHAIYDNSAKRSFSRADVNTIIALFSAPVYSERQSLQNIARFVQFRKPFEEVINPGNLKEIEKIKSRGYIFEGKGIMDNEKCTTDEGRWKMEEGERNFKGGKGDGSKRKDETGENIIARVVPLTQQELLIEGWEFPSSSNQGSLRGVSATKQSLPTKTGIPKKGKFIGDKWGGKYLRAPDIFFTILEKGRDKLVRLGDIAEVRFGIKTGCNEFFYLPSKHFDIKKTDDGKYWKLIPKHESLPEGMMIEEEYLVPIIKSAKNSLILLLKKENLSTYILKVNSNEDIEKYNINKYIKWGEENKYQDISSVKNRKRWYDVGHKDVCDAIILRRIGERMPVFEANGFLEDCCLFGIKFFQRSGIEQNIVLLNSSFIRLLIEINTRELTGAQAVADTNVFVIREIPVIKQNVISNEYMNELERIWKTMRERESYSFFIESGIKQSLPIRQQIPNPLPDRKALDDIIFDILNLTEDERNEVYWSVCELVKARLDKAKSV